MRGYGNIASCFFAKITRNIMKGSVYKMKDLFKAFGINAMMMAGTITGLGIGVIIASKIIEKMDTTKK
jgi:K+-transporting ATPase A subunit